MTPVPYDLRAPGDAGVQSGSASVQPGDAVGQSGGTARTAEGAARTAAGLESGNNPTAVVVPDAPSPTPRRSQGNIDWAGLFTEQFRVDGSMHLYRLSQEKTRVELHTTSYFGEYPDALRGYFTTGFRWSDGDSAATNNISHLLLGAAYSHVYTNHDRRCSATGYGDAGYWSCFGRAAIYTAIATFNWEWNPLLSESTLGHVGRHYACVNGWCTGEGGWTDFVMTPLGGLGVRLAGDLARVKLWPILDRHLSGSLGARFLNTAAKMATDPGRMANAAFNLDFKGVLATPVSYGRR